MNLSFISVLVLMLLVGLGFLLWPLIRRTVQPLNNSADMATIYRSQLTELEADFSAGQLTEVQYQQAKAELALRLKAEMDGQAAPENNHSKPFYVLAFFLLLLLPAASIAIYQFIGTPEASTAAGVAALEADVPPQAAEIQAMVAQLAAKLEQNPDDPEGWKMLGRSYRVMGRLEEAEQAYAQAVKYSSADDPDAVADYAEMLAAHNPDEFSAESLALFRKALSINPEQPKALWYLGQQAFDNADYPLAVSYWERLLAQEPPEQVATLLQRQVDEAKRFAGAGQVDTQVTIETTERGPELLLDVSLSPAIADEVPTDATLFVYARIPNGMPMPLAIWKGTVAQLPARISLSDADAMMPSHKLSEHSRWSVIARVSPGGEAKPQPGDWFGEILTDQINFPLDLVIDSRL